MRRLPEVINRQPARANRELVEQMTEGKPLENTRYESINFSKENFLKKRM